MAAMPLLDTTHTPNEIIFFKHNNNMNKNYQTPEIRLIEMSVESGYALSHTTDSPNLPPEMPNHGTEAFSNSGDEFTLS